MSFTWAITNVLASSQNTPGQLINRIWHCKHPDVRNISAEVMTSEDTSHKKVFWMKTSACRDKSQMLPWQLILKFYSNFMFVELCKSTIGMGVPFSVGRFANSFVSHLYHIITPPMSWENTYDFSLCNQCYEREKLQCVAQVEDLATYNSTASSTELVYDTACPQEQNWQSAYVECSQWVCCT